MSCLRSYVLLTVLIMGETLELNYYSEDMDPNTIYTGYLIKFVESSKMSQLDLTLCLLSVGDEISHFAKVAGWLTDIHSSCIFLPIFTN